MNKNLSNYLYPFFMMLLLFASCEKMEVVEEEEMEEEVEIPMANVLEQNAGCPDTLAPVYLEKDGILHIEIESSKFASTSWQLDSTISGASNGKYLVWKGPNLFNEPGNGILNFRIRISDPGTYQFIWRSRITAGNSNTDLNDSWLRIPNASHFYAQKENGNIVYPKGSNLPPIEASAGQADTTPEGAGKSGWFKVYMNNLNQWAWRSKTSDNDPHQIFAVFDDAGDYTIQVSGRSNGHGIDKFVFYREGVNFQIASAADLSEAVCE